MRNRIQFCKWRTDSGQLEYENQKQLFIYTQINGIQSNIIENTGDNTGGDLIESIRTSLKIVICSKLNPKFDGVPNTDRPNCPYMKFGIISDSKPISPRF